MTTNVKTLIAAVDHGILDAADAIAKDYLSDDERDALRTALADE